jgi:transcriptional regulator with XRE-family HTH domain
MKLNEILAERKMSQRRLSMAAGITNQDLNGAINGKRPFYPAWRKRIAEALRLPEDELFPEYASRKTDDEKYKPMKEEEN